MKWNAEFVIMSKNYAECVEEDKALKDACNENADKPYEIPDWWDANAPSGLGQILLCSNWWDGKYRKVDFTGTTNKEAVEKVLKFYKHKTYRRLVGDHIFFEGVYFNEKLGEDVAFLGS